VLDTVAFGDIQGEDIRHFTEANFVKIFRLAQLMVQMAPNPNPFPMFNEIYLLRTSKLQFWF